MNKESFVIDKITEKIAHCENLTTGQQFTLNAATLPPNTKEGDILHKKNGQYEIDHLQTSQRHDALSVRLNNLFKRTI